MANNAQLLHRRMMQTWLKLLLICSQASSAAPRCTMWYERPMYLIAASIRNLSREGLGHGMLTSTSDVKDSFVALLSRRIWVGSGVEGSAITWRNRVAKAASAASPMRTGLLNMFKLSNQGPVLTPGLDSGFSSAVLIDKPR